MVKCFVNIIHHLGGGGGLKVQCILGRGILHIFALGSVTDIEVQAHKQMQSETWGGTCQV